MSLLARFQSIFPREGLMLLLAALAVMVPGWVKGINLLLLLAFLVIALGGVNFIAAGWQVGRLRGRRRWLEPLFAGSESHWEIEADNVGRVASSWFRLVDAGPDHREEWFISRAEPGQLVRRRAAVILPRRGRYLVEPLRAVCLYPFGLARRQRTLAPAEEVVVLPRLGRLNLIRFQRWLARLTRGDRRLHRLARPSMIHQDDLHGLRPFRPGDNPRWVHWRTSARRNVKMVREFEEDTGQNLIVVLEPWSGAGGPALEAAISLAATLVWEWCRHSTDYLMLAIAGETPFVRGGYASRDNALTMLRELATARGGSTADPASLLRAAASVSAPEAPLLVVSPRTQSSLAGRLGAAWNRPAALLTVASAAEFYDAPPPSEPPA